jgi:uncharacterized phage protein (TIGR02218 family)
MRNLPAALQAHLDEGATTLAWCWKLLPRHGEAIGFTDHDRDLVFAGLTYRAQSGFTGSEIHAGLGLSVDNLDVAGALDDERLTEIRLRAGDFDGAEIEIWLVNWQDVSQRTLLRKGHLGEVSHGELGFTAELRGLAHLLNQPQGRVFQYGCDAIVGDARCGVDLDSPAFSGMASVLSVTRNRIVRVSGLEAYASGWFSGGVLAWTSGGNDARTMAVRTHVSSAAGTTLELWQDAPHPILIGDSLAVTAGCDKQFSTCRQKFANGVNFRGFPHMPGNDFVASYPDRGDVANDGGRRDA